VQRRVAHLVRAIDVGALVQQLLDDVLQIVADGVVQRLHREVPPRGRVRLLVEQRRDDVQAAVARCPREGICAVLILLAQQLGVGGNHVADAVLLATLRELVQTFVEDGHLERHPVPR
jgi:hypothetical protein